MDAFAEYGELNDREPFDEECEGIGGKREEDADDVSGEEDVYPRICGSIRKPSISPLSDAVVLLPPDPLRRRPSNKQEIQQELVMPL